MFKFNGNYEDLEQVKEFYPEFRELFNEKIKKGEYPYNSSFRGKIEGIKGKDEDVAIYLLQHVQTRENRKNKIKALLESGFEEIKDIKDGEKKFERVIVVGTDYSSDSVIEFDKARILREPGKRETLFILPKGKRRKGYRVKFYNNSRVFVRN